LLKIKRADKEEAQIITDIKTRAYNKEINTYFRRNGGPPGYNKVESQLYIIKEFIAYKIILNEKIIGAFFLEPINDTHMRFEDFVIDPDYQNNGYGYQVMKLVESKYSNIKKWSLSTPVFSVGNQHLYEKFGYVEKSRNEHEIHYIKVIS